MSWLICFAIYLQEKYNRVMRDKADLSDKADQLEHIVLQLQGETDTIGLYMNINSLFLSFFTLIFGDNLFIINFSRMRSQ